MFDTAHLIEFEEPNYDEIGVGFDETKFATVTLAAKPPPYKMSTYKSPGEFDSNGYLLPLLGSLRKPLPNNYPVSFSAKTSKYLPSEFGEMPLTAEINTGNYSDSSEEEWDINFTSNSDEKKTLNLEYASDECASERTTQKKFKEGIYKLCSKS